MVSGTPAGYDQHKWSSEYCLQWQAYHAQPEGRKNWPAAVKAAAAVKKKRDSQMHPEERPSAVATSSGKGEKGGKLSSRSKPAPESKPALETKPGKERKPQVFQKLRASGSALVAKGKRKESSPTPTPPSSPKHSKRKRSSSSGSRDRSRKPRQVVINIR